MAATIRAAIATLSGPTLASAEGGAKYNQEHSLAGTTSPIPRPTSTGTEFSWPKVYCLEVTGTDSTSTSNKRLHISGAETAGLKLWYRDDGDVFNEPAAEADSPSGSNGATPTGYTDMPEAATQFDAGSDSNGSTGRVSEYVSVALGVSNNYAGGAGSAISLPDLILTYDES